MTAPTPFAASKAQEAARLNDRYHTLSGRFIEKCAEAERYVLRLLDREDADVKPRAPLSCKLKALRDIIEPQSSSGQAKKLAKLLNELEPLADLRTELAHSTSCIGRLDGELMIFLKNAAEQHPRIDRRLAISPDDLRNAHVDLSILVNQLSQMASTKLHAVSPAPSAPQRQPAASVSKPAPPPPAAPGAK